MTRFVLDARTASGHFPGIGRYVTNLARALPPLLRPGEELILLNAPSSSIVHRSSFIVHPSPFSLRQQWAIPRLLRRLGADLYHSPYYLMPYRPGLPTVLTVYDFIPLRYPQHTSPRARLLFRWTTALALRAASHVITISQATRCDLLAHYRYPPEKVTAIPLAPDPAFRPQPPAETDRVRQKYALPEEYVLYLGINKPHKNLVRLVEAWALLRRRRSPSTVHCSLLIAGAWDPRYPQPKQRAEELGLGDAVRFLGPIPDADLPGLYAGATLFVFPSLYEGFGLPVLEAMACGLPVACSRASSLPEVAGDAALFFDPGDPAAIADALADALQRLLADSELRADLRQRGLARAARFSCERVARETVRVYRQGTLL